MPMEKSTASFAKRHEMPAISVDHSRVWTFLDLPMIISSLVSITSKPDICSKFFQ